MNLLQISLLAEPELSVEVGRCVREHLNRFLILRELHPLGVRHHWEWVSLSEAFWLWRLANDLAPTVAARVVASCGGAGPRVDTERRVSDASRNPNRHWSA